MCGLSRVIHSSINTGVLDQPDYTDSDPGSPVNSLKRQKFKVAEIDFGAEFQKLLLAD